MSGLETGEIPPPRIPKSSKRYDAPPPRDLASNSSINSTPPRATASTGGTDARGGNTASNPIFTSPINDDDPPASAHSLSTKASSDSISTLPYLRDTPPRTRPPVNATQREDAGPPTLGSSSGGPSNPRNLGGRLGPPGRKLSAEKTGKKRPTPLDLGQARSIGLDEELDYQRDLDAPQTGRSLASETAGSTLSTEMEDLSILRQSIRDNLKARPVDSPLLDTMSVRSGQFSDAPTPKSAQLSSTDAPSTATIAEVIDLLGTASRSQTQIIIVDTRPLGDFLTSHLPRSSNVSIPSLIFKRFKKQSLQSSTPSTTTATWESLASFVSTVSGKEIWSRINPKARTEVFVLGTTAGDETARVLRDIMSGMVRKELGSQVRIIQGGWAAVVGDKEASSQLVVGEFSQQQPSSSSRQEDLNNTLTPPKTAPFKLAPPPIPSEAPSAQRQISHHPSMPSLRGEKGLGSRRNLPSLTVHTAQTGASGSKRPPKLSLNLDRPLRSATLDGSFPSLEIPASPVTRVGGLQVPGSGPIRPKSPQLSSFQALCHQQSKLPPSPSSFGGITSHITDGPSSANPTRGPKSPWHDASASGPMGRYPNATPTTGYLHTPGMETSRSTGLIPFIVSTILPSFLYLGPELTGQGDIDKLRELGVRRILNVAVECDSDEELGLRGIFDKYMKLPMRDIVEESGVGKGMRDACDFLDDARLHSAPTYVHCKAGKSRSVTVVLAYLIHANAWTLKTSYAYVAERRKGISPNIGFVAELMQFEEQELGIKQSGGVHGESGSSGGGGGGAGRKSAQPHLTEGSDNVASKAEEEDKERGKSNPRYMRESLPPTWSHSLDSGRPGKVALGNPRDGETKGEESEGRKVVGDDREVRKNGHWVHHRRAPVDRTTLQPGRRVSKAGLESLRPLAPAKPDHSDSGSSGERSGSSSPQPMTSALSTEHESSTPGPEGRLGWV